MTEQSQSREGAPRPAEDTPGLSTTAALMAALLALSSGSVWLGPGVVVASGTS